MIVKIKRLTETAIIPRYQTSGAAAIDLHADIEKHIEIQGQNFMYMKSCCHLIPTGLAIQIPRGYVGVITPRSGLGHRGLILGNGIGIIDSDYRGEIFVSLWNRTDEWKTINPSDRIAQMLFMPVEQVHFTEVYALEDTKRGSDGFGSTGK